MMRVNLLRPLPPNTENGSAAPRREPRGGGPLKPALLVLLLLGAAGALVVGLTKPEWLKPERLAHLWNRAGREEAESLRRAQAVAAQASRLVDARQEAAIEWLYQLELLQPDGEPARGAAAEPPVTLTLATFTASGEFLIAGTAVSAGALSAVQEALVLVPGMDLRESRALEIAGTAGPAFDFRFTGRLDAERPAHAAGDNGAAVTDSAIAPDTAAGPPAPVAEAPPVLRNRVIDSAAVTAQRDTLLHAASAKGFTFAPAKAAAPVRSGALTARGWKMKGAFAGTENVFTALREVLELERHRGSPFAIQRITVEQAGDQKTVFLDILALTP